MKTLAATVALLLATSPAFAVTLTFDSLSASGGVSSNTYTESGYTLTAAPGGVHYGDGGVNVAGVFDWHSTGSNGTPQAWVLTKNGGGAFDLVSFLNYQRRGDIRLSAIGFGPVEFASSGTKTLNWTNLTSVRFSFGDERNWEQGGIDNIVLNETSPVPVPAGLPLLASGAALLGLLMRRRKTS